MFALAATGASAPGWSLSLVTGPSSEPVTIAQAKQYARVTSTIEDDRIADLIASAREDLDGKEGWLGRAIMPQTWALTLDGFPWPHSSPIYERRPDAGAILVPLPPLQSVTGIAYTDQDGNAQTVDTAIYRVDAAAEPGRILLRQDQAWPLTIREPASVVVTFVAGYTKVPQKIRNLIFSIVAWRFENREGGVLPESIMDQVSALKARF